MVMKFSHVVMKFNHVVMKSAMLVMKLFNHSRVLNSWS